MPKRRGTQTQRRALVEAMLIEDAGRSDRSIGRAVGCHHTTVANARRRLELAEAISPRPSPDVAARQAGHPNLLRTVPGTPGGRIEAGCYSDLTMAPLRFEAESWARERWRWLDETRLKLVADLAAKVEAERRWRDEHGLLRNRRHGIPWPITVEADRWAKRLNDLITRLDAEGRGREADGAETLESYVASLNGGGDGD